MNNDIPIEPRQELIYIVCPLCGLNRILEKSGRFATRRHKPIEQIKGRIRFDRVNLNRLIVQVRDPSRGRAGGLNIIGGLTFQEFITNPDYADLVEQMKSQCQQILDALKEL
jgi:hypothetical protein